MDDWRGFTAGAAVGGETLMVGRAGTVRLHGLGQDLAPGILQPGYTSVTVDPQTGTVVVPSSGSATTSTVYYQQGTADTGNPLTTTPGSGGGSGAGSGGAAGSPGGGGGSIFGSPGGSPGGSPFGTCDPNSGWGKIFGCASGGGLSLATILLLAAGVFVLVEVVRR